ncbi:hypothetical protein LB553_07165 [Mesorhizobium sp. CA8]|uniref:hypothetical protein n=1 Tax=Mesorhizobium sp. CA8 TaxID=2876637 RepID=UPI001CCEE46B|nr:hypothetical protein [Mesorhizobium sp. CA8]MBZ9760657.1 hypothetical protein [Mesorhizobium sp. CA8]
MKPPFPLGSSSPADIHAKWRERVRSSTVEPDEPMEQQRATFLRDPSIAEIHRRSPPSDPTEGDERLNQILGMLSADDTAGAGSPLIFMVKFLEIVDHFVDGSAREDFRVSRMAAALDDISEGAGLLAPLLRGVVEQLDAIGKEVGGPLDEFVNLSIGSDIDDLLHRISLSAGAARGAIVRKYGSGDPDLPDRGSGGGRGIHASLYGSPKQKFIRHLAFLWHVEAGKPLTSTNTGPFAAFVRLAYAFATGKDDEKALKDDIGLAVNAMKNRGRIAARASEHFRKSMELRAAGNLAEADFMARRAERLQNRLAIPRFERKAKRTTLAK